MPHGEENPERLTVALLADQHDRERFDCGIEPLNGYFRERANQDARRGVAVTYVLVESTAPAEVFGFYTLSSSTVALADLPQPVSKKLPRYPLVPATLIGRLAVAKSRRGRRLGERLLVDALARCLDASRRVASVAVFVDAKDDDAAGFYRRYGFTPLPAQPHRPFIPMKTIARLWPVR
jgi:GNAT superfamily N-acetyltransferase